MPETDSKNDKVTKVNNSEVFSHRDNEPGFSSSPDKNNFSGSPDAMHFEVGQPQISNKKGQKSSQPQLTE